MIRQFDTVMLQNIFFLFQILDWREKNPIEKPGSVDLGMDPKRNLKQSKKMFSRMN